MYYPGRQEGQFDIGLVNRWNAISRPACSRSFKYLNFREFQNGGGLAQGAFTVDYLFSRGKRRACSAPRASRTSPSLNRTQLGPELVPRNLRPHRRTRSASARTVGLAGNSYLEGNLAYLQSHGAGGDRPGGNVQASSSR